MSKNKQKFYKYVSKSLRNINSLIVRKENDVVFSRNNIYIKLLIVSALKKYNNKEYKSSIHSFEKILKDFSNELEIKDSLFCREHICMNYDKLEEYEICREKTEELYEDYVKEYSKNHPNSIGLESMLLNCYFKLKDISSVKQKYIDLKNRIYTFYKKDDEYMLFLEERIGVCHYLLKEYDNSNKILKNLLDVCIKKYGEDNEQCVRIKFYLGHTQWLASKKYVKFSKDTFESILDLYIKYFKDDYGPILSMKAYLVKYYSLVEPYEFIKCGKMINRMKEYISYYEGEKKDKLDEYIQFIESTKNHLYNERYLIFLKFILENFTGKKKSAKLWDLLDDCFWFISKKDKNNILELIFYEEFKTIPKKQVKGEVISKLLVMYEKSNLDNWD